MGNFSKGRMKNKLESLENYENISELKPALQLLCARFGFVARLDVLEATQAGVRQALCFLRMESPEQEAKIVRELGVGRFGGDLVLVVDLLPRESANATSITPIPFSGLHEQRTGT
jgi:hypothetical protein